MTKIRSTPRNVGDIVKIDLGSGVSTFGRVLLEPLMAFYDIKGADSTSLEDILSSPILFKIWVMNSAVTSGRWEVIANRSVEDSLQAPIDFFKIDPISKDYSIYRNGEDIPADRGECIGLERAAVWSATHVEDRLRDHFAGAPNKWATSLAP